MFQPKIHATGRWRGEKAYIVSSGSTLMKKITVERREPGRGVEECKPTCAKTERLRKSLTEAENSRGHSLGRVLGKVLSENC